MLSVKEERQNSSVNSPKSLNMYIGKGL